MTTAYHIDRHVVLRLAMASDIIMTPTRLEQEHGDTRPEPTPHIRHRDRWRLLQLRRTGTRFLSSRETSRNGGYPSATSIAGMNDGIVSP